MNSEKLQLAKKLTGFPEYVFSAIAAKIKAVEEQSGRKVLNLGIGSPDFPPSPQYVQKLSGFYNDAKAHMYPPYNALPELTDALVAWYRERFGVTLNRQQIYPLNGGKQGIAYLLLAVTDPGDEILVPDPGYPSYSATALMFGVKPVFYNLTSANNFLPDMMELKKLVNKGKKGIKKPRLIWLNFPANPTGQVISLPALRKLVDFAGEHNLLIAYDNAYSEITFGGYRAPSIFNFPGAKKNAVELQSFSKSFSFAGYRMGWLAGNSEIIAAMAKIKNQFDTGMSLPLQRLAAYALTHSDKNWQKEMITSYQTRRDIIGKKLYKLGVKFSYPKGSLYIWAEIPAGYKNAEEFSTMLLEKNQVFLTPGSAFGRNGSRYVRVSICADISKIDGYL